METKYEKINGRDVKFVKYKNKWLADAYEVAMAYNLEIADALMYLDVEHIEGYYTKMFMYGGVGVEGKVELIGTEGINDMKRGKRINDRAGVKYILPPSPGLITVRNHILNSKLNNKEEK